MKRPTRACVNRKNQEQDGTTSGEAGEDKPACESGGGNIAVDLGCDEFQDPIPLDGIPEDVQQKMRVVAPVLSGRHGVYNERFFTIVAGLCNRGIAYDNVQTQTPISDEEIHKKWKSLASDKYRFPIALCVDNDQAAQFCEQHRLVYGSQPCNDVFSVKFLRACFATFVHKVEVNWVAEAVKRRSRRLDSAGWNRHKLGPVAMREQLACLCAIVSSCRSSSSGNRSAKKRPRLQIDPAVADELEEVLRETQELERRALVSHDSLLQELIGAQGSLSEIQSNMLALHEEYNTTVETTSELKRDPQTRRLAIEKMCEGRALLDKIIELSDLQQKTEEFIGNIQQHAIPKAAKSVEDTAVAVLDAQQNLRNRRSAPLVLQPTAPFLYPTGKSVPELNSGRLQFCAGCSKRGFVARAVIIGSCGCGFHPTCIATALQSKNPTCPHCELRFSGAWMAQFGFPLESWMEDDISRIQARLGAEAVGNSANEADLEEGSNPTEGEMETRSEDLQCLEFGGTLPAMAVGKGHKEPCHEIPPATPSLTQGTIRLRFNLNHSSIAAAPSTSKFIDVEQGQDVEITLESTPRID